MLWTLFVILLVLWLLGVVSSYTLGGFIHVLLVVGRYLAVMQLLQGRRALWRPSHERAPAPLGRRLDRTVRARGREGAWGFESEAPAPYILLPCSLTATTTP